MENSQLKNNLNPKKTALVIIDLQNGTVLNRTPSPHSTTQVVENAVKLTEAFTEKGAFIVFVRISSQDGKDLLRPITDLDQAAHRHSLQEGWDSIIPELARFENAHLITKRQLGAFFGTELDLQLRRRGIDTIVLCGISTSVGVDTTAREAYQYGYNQVFAEDAMTDSVQEGHEYVCTHIFPRFGRIRSTEEILHMLG